MVGFPPPDPLFLRAPPGTPSVGWVEALPREQAHGGAGCMHMGNQPRRPNPDALNADLRRRQRLIRHRRLGVTLPAARERARTRQIIVGLIAGLLVLPIAGAALVLFALGNVAA